MSSESALHIPCGGTVRGFTVDRIIARLRAAKADGARIVNLRCAAAANMDCDDFAMLSAIGVSPQQRRTTPIS